MNYFQTRKLKRQNLPDPLRNLLSDMADESGWQKFRLRQSTTIMIFIHPRHRASRLIGARGRESRSTPRNARRIRRDAGFDLGRRGAAGALI